MRKKVIVCLSGGADSTVLVHWVKSHVDADIYSVAFDYGQRHRRELLCAKQQSSIAGCIEHKQVDLTFLGGLLTSSALTNINIPVPTAAESVGDAQSLAYVPNRNMIMLSILAGYAESLGADIIYYGAQAADQHSGYWDAAPEFLISINEVLNLNRKNKIQILAPFMLWDKNAIILAGINLGVDFKQTHTCYTGTEIACGRCVSDANRIQAFLNAGYIDPIPYAIDIPWEQYNCKPLPY